MTISVVQEVSKYTASSTIPALGSGHLLVVCINSWGSASTPTISGVTIGSAALKFAVTKVNPSTSFPASWIYYLENAPAGQTALAIAGSNLSIGSSSDGGVDIYEVAGIAGSNALDQTAASSLNFAATTWTSNATGALAQASEIAFGTGDLNEPTVSGAWSLTADSGIGKATGYQIVSSTAALTFNGTQPSSTYSAVLATFKAGSVLGASPTPIIASML